jgi:hypothetical protein
MILAIADLLRAILWPTVCAYAVWSAIPTIRYAIDRFAPAKAGVTANDVAIPADLIGLALMESETWAQEDVMRVIRERYDKLRDWNAVRHAMGVAPV